MKRTRALLMARTRAFFTAHAVRLSEGGTSSAGKVAPSSSHRRHPNPMKRDTHVGKLVGVGAIGKVLASNKARPGQRAGALRGGSGQTAVVLGRARDEIRPRRGGISLITI